MSSLSDQFEQFINKVERLHARTHAEIAIVGAAIIEEKLAEAILGKMRPLSRRMKTRLFEGYGPLSSFSAKIELSFAFGIIDQKTQCDLNIVRRIRNLFAHSVSLVNFGSPEIQALLKNLNISVAKESQCPLLYVQKLKEIEQRFAERKMTEPQDEAESTSL